MRRFGGAAAALLALSVLTGCAGDPAQQAGQPAGAAAQADAPLEERTAEAGAVTVAVTPRRVDADGADFEVVFDTHSVELDTPLPDSARLTVDGQSWPASGWSGGGPGGHHREGTLSFGGGGPHDGPVELTITGLPEDVSITWPRHVAR